MRRDLRELAVLLAAGLFLGLGHLALRTDLPWVPAPQADVAMCDAAAGPAPASASTPEPLMSSEEAP